MRSEDDRSALTTDELGPGVDFGGHRIEARVGGGATGVVFRARQLRLDRVVALKVIAPQLASDVAFRDLFRHQMRRLASFDDPHVVEVYDWGEVGGRFYLTMRYVDGINLKELLANEGPLPAVRSADIIAQVAKALDAAHCHGLVHRDVKPHNILVTRRDGRDHAYLTDFGLTKREEATPLAATKGGAGSPAYMAPEQIVGQHVDALADVYSLGLVLYELLAGHLPSPRANPPLIRELSPDVAAKFGEIVARALDERPYERYQSAGDLSVAALAAAEGQSIVRPERSVATGEAAPGKSHVVTGIQQHVVPIIPDLSFRLDLDAIADSAARPPKAVVEPRQFRRFNFEHEWLARFERSTGTLATLLALEARQWLALGIDAGYFIGPADRHEADVAVDPALAECVIGGLSLAPEVDEHTFAVVLSAAQADLTEDRLMFLSLLFDASDSGWNAAIQAANDLRRDALADARLTSEGFVAAAWCLHGMESSIGTVGLPASWRGRELSLPVASAPAERLGVAQELRVLLVAALEAAVSRTTSP